MKKLILSICLLFLCGYMGFAQEEDVVSSSSGRLKHVAYSPSTSALLGVHGGLLGNTGGIVDGGDIVESLGAYVSFRYNSSSFINVDRLSIDIGATLQVIEPAYVFVGLGYGKFENPPEAFTITENKEISGLELDGGVIIKISKFTLHAGLTTIKFNHLDFYGGIGYTF